MVDLNNNIQQSLISAAMHLIEAEELDIALDVLHKVLDNDPDCVKAHLLQGSVYQSKGNLKASEDSFRKSYSLDQSDPDVLRGLGFFLVSQERFVEAQPILRVLFIQDTNDVDVAKALFNAIPRNQEYKTEIKNLIEFAWNKNKNPDLALLFSRRLAIYKLYDEAIKILEDALSVTKTSTLLDKLGGLYLNKRDFERSLSCLFEATVLDPQNDVLFNHLSIVYTISNQKNQAVDAINKAIALNPSSYDNYSQKSLIAMIENDASLMLESANASIALLLSLPLDDPIRVHYLSNEFSNKFNSQIKLGMVEEAFAEVAHAKSLYPYTTSLYSAPAKYFADHNKFNEALAELDSARDPSTQRITIPLRFRILHLLGQPDEAWKCIKPFSIDSTEVMIDELIDQGVSSYSAGQINAACSIHRQLLEIDSTNRRLLTNLSYMLIGSGDYHESKKLLNTILESETKDDFHPIAMCNLIYLNNIVGEFQQALELVMKFINSDNLSDVALLRVPFWVNDSMHTDHFPLPGRALRVIEAALGCGIAAALALKKVEQAESFLTEIKNEEKYSKSLSFLLDGCISLAKGNLSDYTDLLDNLAISKASAADKSKLREWLSEYQKSIS